VYFVTRSNGDPRHNLVIARVAQVFEYRDNCGVVFPAVQFYSQVAGAGGLYPHAFRCGMKKFPDKRLNVQVRYNPETNRAIW
jgi:hypothetical protein